MVPMQNTSVVGSVSKSYVHDREVEGSAGFKITSQALGSFMECLVWAIHSKATTQSFKYPRSASRTQSTEEFLQVNSLLKWIHFVLIGESFCFKDANKVFGGYYTGLVGNLCYH